jgi:hypothetical protein
LVRIKMASDEIKLIKNAEKNSILKIEKAKNDNY